ncbi:MAG TPA: hypothetical protein V6D11_02570 [Waterburya sp.]
MLLPTESVPEPSYALEILAIAPREWLGMLRDAIAPANPFFSFFQARDVKSR